MNPPLIGRSHWRPLTMSPPTKQMPSTSTCATFRQPVGAVQAIGFAWFHWRLHQRPDQQLGYARLGLGRTNTRDYYIFNFDPNNSAVYGIGTRLLPISTISIFTVKDNCLHTGQMITHTVRRMLPDGPQGWTVDSSSKHGRATADSESVFGRALSVTDDYRDIFFRLAQYRKVNFTPDDQTYLTIWAAILKQSAPRPHETTP